MVVPGRPALGWPALELEDLRAAIRLRRWVEPDAAALVDAWADPEIAAHCGVPADAGPERATAWIAGCSDRSDRGVALDLVIADVATDAVFGEVGVRPFLAPPNGAAVEDVMELGWWVGAPHRRIGRATAAVRLLTDWLFRADVALQVVARIQPGHVASEAIAERSGFINRGPLDDRHALWVRSAATVCA